ncbi:MAG: helix-turn-helix transcriptional regulator, partial [Patescibacteria group bacterium]
MKQKSENRSFVKYIRDARFANLKNKAVFVRLFKRGRMLSGISTQKAAEKFRTSPGTISRWENGHSAPPVLARIAAIHSLSHMLWQLSR